MLLVPGLWKELSLNTVYNLAESFLSTPGFGFGVFVAVAAHPLTTPTNLTELNPHVCGNFSFPIMEKRFFSQVPIGTGEENFFSGEVDFTIARNAKSFFFVKMKRKEVGKKEVEETPKMFEAAHFFSFPTYKGLPLKKAASDISEQFALFSIEKKFKESFSCFLRANVPFKPLQDSYGICPFFSQCQIYSVEDRISRDKCFGIFGGDRENLKTPLIGSTFCDGATVVNPCTPEGKTRILKFSRMDSVKGAENRSAILALLDQLNIVREVFPISQFYYKIRLLDSVSDQSAVEILKKFNQSLKGEGPLFHTLFDGVSTTSLVFRPPPSVRTSLPRAPQALKRKSTPSVLILEDPPVGLSLANVSAWVLERKIPHPLPPFWALSPASSPCVVVPFFPSGDDVVPEPESCVELDGQFFKLLHKHSLPFSYRQITQAPLTSTAARPLLPKAAPSLPKNLKVILEKIRVDFPNFYDEVKVPSPEGGFLSGMVQEVGCPAPFLSAPLLVPSVLVVCPTSLPLSGGGGRGVPLSSGMGGRRVLP